MLAHAGGQPVSRFAVIPNGFDEEDFSELPYRQPERSPVRIIHTGLVDERYRSPRPFLEALSTLLRNGDISHSDVRAKFVGGGPYVESPKFRALLGQLGLAALVEVLVRVSYSESLEHQQCSHILLQLLRRWISPPGGFVWSCNPHHAYRQVLLPGSHTCRLLLSSAIPKIVLALSLWRATELRQIS
jgi:glycosyltransferase involved in cell wall biosynthesis